MVLKDGQNSGEISPFFEIQKILFSKVVKLYCAKEFHKFHKF